jgi:hypothetical protein
MNDAPPQSPCTRTIYDRQQRGAWLAELDRICGSVVILEGQWTGHN